MQCYRCGKEMTFHEKDQYYVCTSCLATCSYDYSKGIERDRACREEATQQPCETTLPPAYPYKEVKNPIREKADQIARLVEEKNKAYGNSFGESEKILRVLYPKGIPPENYKDILTIARILDKIFRIANQKDYAGENPYEDIAGYALLASTKR